MYISLAIFGQAKEYERGLSLNDVGEGAWVP
jgi:hypothetical protein